MFLSYQALYRVWRPQQFTDVVGQEHITKTLQNALEQQKISHAYLFSGPRGTGKTSAAKIFAKTVNCENSPTDEPCNECAVCRGITDGSIPDVIEIDAASNNGVDEIRDIREKVHFAPSSATYKVYIIDEVHMLTTGAYNALLKTLEEPPAHVIFILATTEPHKIPLTVISRCQRFDFKRISIQSMIGRMQQIVQETGVSCEEDALAVIARAAEGGMRDALSLLDQAISYSDNDVTEADALAITGTVSQNVLIQMAKAMNEKDVAAGLETLDTILFAGKDPARFIEDFIFFYRDMLLYKTAPQLEESLERTMLGAGFETISAETSTKRIYEIIALLNKTQQEIKWTNHPRVFLEVAIVKLCHLEQQGDNVVGHQEVTMLQNRVTELEKELASIKSTGISVQETAPTPPKAAQRRPRKGYTAPVGRINEVLSQATKEDLTLIKRQWANVLQELANQQMRSQAALLNDAEPVAASSTTFVVQFKYEIHCQMAMENNRFLETLAHLFQTTIGKSLEMVGVTESQWKDIREDFIKNQKQTGAVESNAAEEDPIVAEAEKLFGSDLIEIKE